MKKTFLFCLVSILMLSTFNFSCKVDKEITNATIEKTVTVTNGEIANIELSSNPSTGYKWEIYKNGNSKVASMKDQKYIAPEDNGMIGVAGKDLFTFDSHKKGEAVIIFKYIKKGTPDEIGKTKIYKIIVK